MPDKVDLFLPQRKSYRLPGLELGDDLVYPNYAGGSILNLPDTVCQIMNLPLLSHGPLQQEMLDALDLEGVRRVVLILMDALALHRLRQWLADGDVPVWQALINDGLLLPLTSITPSTTSAALPTLWTGRSAAEHGVTGYEMWMREYGVVANTILHAPITFRGEAGTLERAGFDPKTYLPWPTLGAHLAGQGVPSHAFQHRSIIHSGLSQMFLKDARVHGVGGPVELSVNLRHLLEDQAGQPLYTWVYWGEVDHYGHFYGPDDERSREEFVSFSATFQRLFIDKLSLAARRNTLLLLTADHGQITTRLDPHYDLNNHPSLTRRLHLLPTGENRLAYLHIRPGQTEAVREYIERTWPNQFVQLDPLYAVEHGLFGPGEPHPHLLSRLGDLIVLAKGQAYWWWSSKENHLRGRHGGLHPQEMLVPLVAARL